MKKIAYALIGALVCAMVGAASAVVGTAPPPNTSYALQDGTWLNGVAGGQNYTYQNGVIAAGTTQATATQLSSGNTLIHVGTAAASSGVALPSCVAGAQVSIMNAGASTLTVYPAITNNRITAAQDTINAGTSFSGGIASNATAIFFCPKDGLWGAK